MGYVSDSSVECGFSEEPLGNEQVLGTDPEQDSEEPGKSEPECPDVNIYASAGL